MPKALYEVRSVEPGLDICKSNVSSSALFLQPTYLFAFKNMAKVTFPQKLFLISLGQISALTISLSLKLVFLSPPSMTNRKIFYLVSFIT